MTLTVYRLSNFQSQWADRKCRPGKFDDSRRLLRDADETCSAKFLLQRLRSQYLMDNEERVNFSFKCLLEAQLIFIMSQYFIIFVNEDTFASELRSAKNRKEAANVCSWTFAESA